MIYIGCCGFCLSRQRYFSMFNVVEIQETFYDPPDIVKLKRIAQEAPQGFVFSMKAWQAITHPLDSPTWRKARFVLDKSLADRYGFLKPTKEVFNAWEKVVEGAKTLNAKVVVIQTPPSFSYSEENYRNVVEFFTVVDTKDFYIGWEPRGTWLQNKEKIADVVARFKSVIHVVDPFKTLPAIDKEVTYFRLHGIGEKDVNYRYKYTQQDFEKLLEIIKIVKSKSNEIYILFNNIYMAQEAQEFKSMIKTLQI
uniref:DUF72 domain-containing protein n=1 Tax=Ignisphaera aggregans TaxID=334771 RepID=A0A7C5TI77_9CREN